MIEKLQIWIYLPEAWAILGLGLAVTEVVIGGMVALPLGFAALVVAGLMWAGLVTSWQLAVVIFGVLGIIAALVAKKVIRDTEKAPDINDY